MTHYKDQLVEIDKEYKKTNKTGVVLIDFDIFQNSNDFNSSLFSCERDKLPDYAVAKLEKIDRNSNCFALKHVGLCLITELSLN